MSRAHLSFLADRVDERAACEQMSVHIHYRLLNTRRALRKRSRALGIALSPDFPMLVCVECLECMDKKNIYAESARRLDPSAPQNSIRSAVRTLRTRTSFLLRFEELMNAFASCPEFQRQFEWLTSELGEEGFREKHRRGGRSPQQTPVLFVKKCAVSRSIPIAENEFRLANP